jgi:hypothetical protein
VNQQHPDFTTEAVLCAAYQDFARASGWLVYPETAGFDMLLVRPEGHPHAGTQIGVEAKLKLNAKVVDQILDVTPCDVRWEQGPDYRVVLVADPGRASGLARLLSRCGVTTVAPVVEKYSHPVTRVWPDEERCWRGGWYVLGNHAETPWTDLNPTHRCELPEFIPTVPAGVPSPVQLSRWKIGALRVLALLELHGSVTNPDIKKCGCDPSVWTRAPNRWLDPVERGRFARSDRLPRFDLQHPDIYAQILEEARAKESLSP